MNNNIFFAPEQLPDYIKLKLVANQKEFDEFAASWNDDAKEDTYAACFLDADSKGPDFGYIVFRKDCLNRGLIVHEVTHAAMFFCANILMESPEIKTLSEKEQTEYFEEACARITEFLFNQIDPILFP